MAERRLIGTWLSGVRTPGEESTYPGQRLELPETGPGSVANMGRRLLALLADWLLCMIIAQAAFRPAPGLLGWWTLAVFSAETWLLTAFTGLTVGKRLLGIRVARLDGRPVGFFWALVRVALLITVVPALVTDRDLRGLHDRAANTIVIRL